jgi:hypothetical protein
MLQKHLKILMDICNLPSGKATSGCILLIVLCDFEAFFKLFALKAAPSLQSNSCFQIGHHLPIKISGSNARIAQKRCAFPSSLQSRPLVHFASERARGPKLKSAQIYGQTPRARSQQRNQLRCARGAFHAHTLNFQKTLVDMRLVTIIYSPRALKQKNSSRG